MKEQVITPQESAAGPEQREKSLEGKVILITGASRDIGAEIARTFARNNPRAIIAPHRQNGKMDDRAQEVVRIVESYGVEMVAPVCDITDPNARQELFDYVNKTYGKVDTLIHNAGGGYKITSAGPKDFVPVQNAFNVNAKAKEQLTEIFLPIMSEDGVVLDAASKMSQFYDRDIGETIDSYDIIASTKKEGGKMVHRAIQMFNAKTGKSIRFGTVCGHAVDGTLIAKQIRRKDREKAERLRKTALNGVLPSMNDMANAYLKMATQDFEDGHVEFVGMPAWEKERIKQELPMYDENTLYLDKLVFFDPEHGFGYLKVRAEHTQEHFNPDEFSIEKTIFPQDSFIATLKINEEHTAGHFTLETGISVLSGHKQIAALIQAYEKGFKSTLEPDEYMHLMGIYNVKFMQPALPMDDLKIFIQDSLNGYWNLFMGDADASIGKNKISLMENVSFALEKGEKPNMITPDRLIEGAAQTLGCLYLNQRVTNSDLIPVLQGFAAAEFGDITALPDQTVEIEAKLIELNEKGFTGDVNVWVDDKKAAVIEGIKCGIVSKNRMTAFLHKLQKRRSGQEKKI